MMKSVAAYIAKAPKATQTKLRQIRAAIRQAAPRAEESISYGMPYYAHKGRLAYFAVFQKHIGLFIPPPILADHQRDLKKYVTTKSSLHLPIKRAIPVTLVKKLIKARMRHNERKAAQKTAKKK